MNNRDQRRVRVINSAKFPSGDSWVLQEFSPDGTYEGREQVPLHRSAYFSCQDLNFSIALFGITEYGTENRKISEKEKIFGTFTPVTNRFSFFGTERSLDSFEVEISQKGDGEVEGCYAAHVVGYEWERDAYNIDLDEVQFHIRVEGGQFEKWKQLILANVPINASLRLLGVDGFYANCDAIYGDGAHGWLVKILAKIPKGVDVKVPILGAVSHFDLTVATKRSFGR